MSVYDGIRCINKYTKVVPRIMTWVEKKIYLKQAIYMNNTQRK